MTPFSIELAIEKITDKNSKENFLEVYKCYENGCYRAAVGLLWSVVVTDIISKLQTVEIDFNDTTAHKLLVEIKDKQRNKETDWEKNIVEDVHKRMKFFDQDTYENLIHLQKKRHLCSHPLIQESDNKLYTPTPEETKSFLRHALEDILTVPAGFSRHALTDSILGEIAKLREAGHTLETFKIIIHQRYLKHLSATVLPVLLRDLWKFVFVKDNEDIEINRVFNAEFLFQVIESQKEKCREIFKEEQYINNITQKERILFIFVMLLSRFDFMYELLNESGKAILETYLSKNNNMRIFCSFLSSDILEHLHTYIPKADNKDFKFLLKLADKHMFRREALQMGLAEYVNCPTFNGFAYADSAFKNYIEDHVNEYDYELFKRYLNVGEVNSQIYDRKQFRESNNIVYKALLEKFDSILVSTLFKTSEYTKFYENLDKEVIEKELLESKKPAQEIYSELFSTDDLPF
jgi:hypothetical protein